MDVTFQHPLLGQLTRKKRAWRGQVSAPAFDRFSYDTGYDAPPPNGLYRLDIDSPPDLPAPPPDGLALAEKVVGRSDRVIEVVTTAFWEEFNGRGPDSGVWWYGALLDPQAARAFDDRPRPTSPADIEKLMRLEMIYVRRDVDGVDGPVVHLLFKAGFEQEHDVGVLTDGDRVLGTGFMEDVVPYGFSDHEH